MKLLHVCLALLSIWKVSGSGVTIGITPYSHPVQTQYHTQDVLGQYVYGYATPTSSKSESKTVDGITQGGYSYIDSNGLLQTVQYISDPVYGFRVAATNLPQDLPEVAIAKAQHLAQFQATQAEHAAIAAKYSNPVVVPVSAVKPIELLPNPVQDLPEVVRARAEHLAAFEAVKARDLSQVAQEVAISPVSVNALPALVPSTTYLGHNLHSYVPAVSLYQPTVSSQYHTQDLIGQYSYGYISPLSSKSESKTADGITRGGYSYIDANGIIQSVNYISDPVNGFRVAGTNLPVAPEILLKGASVSATVAGPVDVPASEVGIAKAKPVLSTIPVNPGLYTYNVYY